MAIFRGFFILPKFIHSLHLIIKFVLLQHQSALVGYVPTYCTLKKKSEVHPMPGGLFCIIFC